MAIAAWSASTAFSVGDIRRPSYQSRHWPVLSVFTAGTSGSSEPSWPNGVGDTVTDNTVYGLQISATYGDLVASATPARLLSCLSCGSIQPAWQQ